MTSALRVRKLTNGAGQKPVSAVLKGVVAGQRQSPAHKAAEKQLVKKQGICIDWSASELKLLNCRAWKGRY
jgi:hypothetical protein